MITRHYLFDETVFSEKIESWRKRYPNHPAEQPVVAELFDKSSAVGKKVKNIALLLPEHGRFAQAGAAVRDGFLSAWYDENNHPDQPMVHVYDANPENIIDVYQQAVEDGADIVVGPLEKKALKNLLSLKELLVKTLVLNKLNDEELTQYKHHIESLLLYQFGLSPEDEASQVAEKAWSDGYTHALTITPKSSWGERLLNAFRDRFEALGGSVLEQQAFDANTSDFSTPVKLLLNIDGSELRYQTLAKTTGRKIKFEPRPRKDADFIFMAAFPVHARQIRPQLLYYRASQLPVISTSHAYGLPPRGEPDLDMEGVIIGDMPWMFEHQDLDSEITPLSMQQDWPDDNAAFLRLFAFGIDAYKIIPHLGQLRLQHDAWIEGATGTLRINEKGQILRKLAWAKFVQGKPKRLFQSTQTVAHETERPIDQ